MPAIRECATDANAIIFKKFHVIFDLIICKLDARRSARLPASQGCHPKRRRVPLLHRETLWPKYQASLGFEIKLISILTPMFLLLFRLFEEAYIAEIM